MNNTNTPVKKALFIYAIKSKVVSKDAKITPYFQKDYF
jgi:hypothetical protein